MAASILEEQVEFLSTPSARRATFDAGACNQDQGYFYPRPPRGGRLGTDGRIGMYVEISIHALREEGDQIQQLHNLALLNFYPRPPRGGRRTDWKTQVDDIAISIHALREEGDQRGTLRTLVGQYFYPRPPRGGRLCAARAFNSTLLFLSTPSARRATRCRRCPAACLQDFYPRPPRGGRQRTFFTRLTTRVFLSTPSARRAT